MPLHRRLLLQRTLGAAALLAGCSGPANTQPAPPQSATPPGLTRVRMGTPGALSDAGLLIAQERGYFAGQGLDVAIETFNSGADQVALLSSGQLDILGGGTSLPLYEAFERGAGFKIVADKGQAPGPDWDYAALAVRKDLVDSGRVRSVADLKGLTVTASGLNNSTSFVLFTALARSQLTPDDITFGTLGYAELPAAFANHWIDAALATEPYMTVIESQGTAVRFMGNSALFGRNQELAVIIYSEQFATNTDLARRWMIAYVRGLRDYNDAFGPAHKGRDEIIQILVKRTPIKDAQLYDHMRPPGLDPDGKLDLDYFPLELDYYKQSDSVDLSKLIDTSFQEYAVQQLGPY